MVKHVTFTLAPVPPFNFDCTAAFNTYFRDSYGANSFNNGIARRVFDLDGRLYLISICSRGKVESPFLEVEVDGAPPDTALIARISEQVAWMLGINQDTGPFYQLAEGDPAMGPLVRAWRGLHIPQTPSIFEGLVWIILGQQISSQVAFILRTLLVQTYGHRLEVNGETYYSFPRPADLAAAGVAGLRTLKLSARKAQYIADISEQVASGRLDLESLRDQPGDEVIQRLISLRGVGMWTVQWLFVRALGRSDGFPYGDLALRHALAQVLKTVAQPGPDEALEISQRWSPYRSYVTTYLFADLLCRLARERAQRLRTTGEVESVTD